MHLLHIVCSPLLPGILDFGLPAARDSIGTRPGDGSTFQGILWPGYLFLLWALLVSRLLSRLAVIIIIILRTILRLGSRAESDEHPWGKFWQSGMPRGETRLLPVRFG